MSDSRQMVERRKHNRFEVPMGAFIVLGPHFTKVGRIIDISMGGIAFRHVDKEEPSNGLYQVDLFHMNSDFCLKNLPCQTLWHRTTDEIPFTSITMRRSGLRFGELTPNQRSLLQYFIQNHTTVKVV
ncbi:MAG: PilZ domain-containing protein [Desulfobacterales bacterium]|nr:MAG: PilZ domain-containing protein [Desulfobacterales bacterium]